MSPPVIEAQIRAVFPTNGGCAVFLGNGEKTFVIYVDQSVGMAITMAMRNTPKERPQTHDLISEILTSVGADVKRIIINDFNEGVYFARLIFEIENEVQQKKIIELDARPSDSIAIAVSSQAPIYVAHHVWQDADDMTEVLEKMERSGFDTGTME